MSQLIKYIYMLNDVDTSMYTCKKPCCALIHEKVKLRKVSQYSF